MNPKYPILLSPGKIGPMELRNKTVMCAMGMNQSDHGFVNDAVINHYVARAKGGVGLIVVEVTCVDTPLGLNTARMLVIDDDKYIPGMTRLANAIHQEGARCVLQISHTGRGARRSVIGAQPVAPSAVAMPYSFMMGLSNETPRALTIEEIHAIEEKYAQAALRAKKAGFDGVEIHSVGYYLGQQFLSKIRVSFCQQFKHRLVHPVKMSFGIRTLLRIAVRLLQEAQLFLCGNGQCFVRQSPFLQKGKSLLGYSPGNGFCCQVKDLISIALSHCPDSREDCGHGLSDTGRRLDKKLSAGSNSMIYP